MLQRQLKRLNLVGNAPFESVPFATSEEKNYDAASFVSFFINEKFNKHKNDLVSLRCLFVVESDFCARNFFFK